MKKIVAVTLNPCVDYTITVPDMEPGGKNMVKSSRKEVAGKGINVCRQVKNLDQPVMAVGFDYVDGQFTVKDALDRNGIPHSLTKVSGRLRTNVKILEPEKRKMTELNEPGTPVRASSVQAVFDNICHVLDELEPKSVLSINGSAPEGVPADFYKRLIEEGKKRQLITVLDASGDLLRLGIQAQPTMIKPNLAEFKQLIGKPVDTVEEIAREADLLRQQQGIHAVCVSMGARGAVFSVEEGCWHGESANVPIRGLQGAGDAMVAAMTMQILEDAVPEYILRSGMAAANAAIQLEGSQVAGALEILGMIDAITIRKIKL